MARLQIGIRPDEDARPRPASSSVVHADLRAARRPTDHVDHDVVEHFDNDIVDHVVNDIVHDSTVGHDFVRSGDQLDHTA